MWLAHPWDHEGEIWALRMLILFFTEILWSIDKTTNSIGRYVSVKTPVGNNSSSEFLGVVI